MMKFGPDSTPKNSYSYPESQRDEDCEQVPVRQPVLPCNNTRSKVCSRLPNAKSEHSSVRLARLAKKLARGAGFQQDTAAMEAVQQ